MRPNREPDRAGHNCPPGVRSDWNVGPRTTGWDQLWQLILGDIGVAPIADARETLESEVGDA